MCPWRDIGRKSSFFHTPLHSTPPLRGFPSEHRHPIWHAKTGMAWLPDGERISKIPLFVLAQLTNVTDRQTDGRTDTTCPHIPRLCIASRGKNRHFYSHRPSFFVCPGDTLVAITQNVAWMKRQFSACQTPRSMYPSIFNSFPVIRTASANKKLSYRREAARCFVLWVFWLVAKGCCK